MSRTPWNAGWLAAVLSLSFGSAEAQLLGQTTWYEKISLLVDSTVQLTTGMDLAAPDAIDDSLTTSGWGASGYLSFGPPGPPDLTAHAYAQRSDGGPVDAAIAESKGYVVFQFVVRRTLAPPVSVSLIPVTIEAHGNTFIRGDVVCDSLGCLVAGQPVASAQITITRSNTTLVDRTITSDSSTPNDRSLILAEDHDTPVDVVVNGRIEVHSTVQMQQLDLNEWGGATATITPDFYVSSEFIPGTYSKYSDYYHLEYSPGYWALGNPTPVQTTTWGKIKSLYSNP